MACNGMPQRDVNALQCHVCRRTQATTVTNCAEGTEEEMGPNALKRGGGSRGGGGDPQPHPLRIAAQRLRDSENEKLD